MKKIFFSAFAVMAVGAAAFSYKVQDANLSELQLANVEALATSEAQQPSLDDCISAPNWTCEALHPTDPSQDKSKDDSKWPS